MKELLKSGDPSNKVDFVFLPEGYTKNEMKKFEEDSKRFMGYLFSWEPYSKYKDAFNIYSVFVPSDESGTDKPREGIWKNTILNSHFSTFYSERYLTIQDVDLVYDLISGVPCDHVVVIVNTDKYGGSGVYNFYTLVAADNKLSETVFLHELGHGFAGLADEYGFDNSYNEFYNFKVEPPEPNLTTLVDFDSKWKSMVEPDIPVPTPDSAKYRNKLGVFEGGGYVAKGIYRPAYDCSMKTNLKNGFCPVCTKAIEDMIRFYTGENKRKQ